MSFSAEFTIANANNSSVLESLEAQRNEKKLCDVTLMIGEDVFPAHRCVLAAASPYFRSMFEEYNFTESRNEEVQLHSVAKNALTAILDMIYTGRLRLDVDIVHNVLAGADHFLMNEVKYACSEFMLMVLKSNTAALEALKIRRSAELYSLTDVEHEADRVISQTFAAVATSPAFCELSFQEVRSLLQSDYIQEGNEAVFWEAAIAWVKHDAEERISFLEKIMECIRFPLIDSDVLLAKIMQDGTMMKVEGCMKLIHEAMQYQLLPRRQSSLQNLRSKPRCTLQDTVLYCLSGSEQFKCYVPRYDKWYSLTAPNKVSENDMETDEKGRACHETLVAIGGVIFACTQATRPEEVGRFEIIRLRRFSLEENKWKPCKLPSKVGVPTFLMGCNESLYAFSRNAIEKYRMDRDLWDVVSISRLSPCQFAVSDDNRVLLYTLEDGISQEMNMDCPTMVNTRQVMSPNRFVTEVIRATKLPNHEVMLLVRTISGISKKIFNVKTNLWRDGNIYHGHNPVQPKPGQHYPLCLDLLDPWHIMCDRNENMLYVLSTKSGITDLPTRSSESKNDGVLPFYKYNLVDKTWTRLACLPESMAASNIQLCLSDGQSSMSSASVL